MEKERSVILEELAMVADSPPQLVDLLLDSLLFPENPLGRDVAGTPESVSGINRDMVINYLGAQYVPNNVVFSIAGNVTHDEIVKAVTDGMGDWKAVRFRSATELRSLAEGSTSVWSTLPETIAVTVFVGGAQSVLLSMIPLTFNDGEKVWTWNRRAWLALALPSTFLFFHVIVNRTGEFSSLAKQPGAIAPLIVALVFLAIAVALWLFFHFRSRSAQRAGLE